MIDEADGTYLHDVQLEYAYLYQFGKGEINAFRMPDDGPASRKMASGARQSRKKRRQRNCFKRFCFISAPQKLA